MPKQWLDKLKCIRLVLLLVVSLSLMRCARKGYRHSLGPGGIDKLSYFISPKTDALQQGVMYVFHPDSTGEHWHWSGGSLMWGVRTAWKQKHDTVYVTSFFNHASPVTETLLVGKKNTLRQVLNQKPLPVFFYYDTLPENLEEMRRKYKEW